MSNLPSAETSISLPFWPAETVALLLAERGGIVAEVDDAERRSLGQLAGLDRQTVGNVHDGLLPRRVELDYWAFTGWMTLGALTLLIVLMIISSR